MDGVGWLLACFSFPPLSFFLYFYGFFLAELIVAGFIVAGKRLVRSIRGGAGASGRTLLRRTHFSKFLEPQKIGRLELIKGHLSILGNRDLVF